LHRCNRRRMFMIPDPDFEIEDVYDDLDGIDWDEED
jgi:hypothetical protein